MASSSQSGRGQGRTQTLGASGSIPDIVDRERGHREREQRIQAQRQSRSLDAKSADHRGKMKLDSSVLRALQGSQARGQTRGGSSSPQPSTSRGTPQGENIGASHRPAADTARAPGGGGRSGQISEPVTRVTVSMAAASSAPRTSQSQGMRSASTSPTPVVQPGGRTRQGVPSQTNQPRPMSIASENSVSINISDERQLIPNRNRDSVGSGHENLNPQQDQAQINTSGINPGVSLNRFETNEALPDILNSHLLPPYTSLRQNQSRSARQQNGRGAQSRPHRHGRSGQSRRRPPGPVTQLDGPAKGCCTKETCFDCITVVTTFRWVLVTLAMLGVCCVVTGIILGALHMTIGNSFLTLSLMFIGLGVMLVVVVGVGWRCTPHGHEPCHLLFNLGDHSSRSPSRSHRSHRPHRDRNGWYGGVLYPEFRHRRPPPSYNASMHEYQQQMIMAQIQQSNSSNQENNSTDNLSLPSSPPPTYRSRASTSRPGLHITFPLTDNNSSRPPTYRSHISDGGGRRPALPMSDSASTSDDNSVNPQSVQVTVETHGTGGRSTVSNSTHSTLGNSRHPTPPRGNDESTLHRAAQVVQYLDNILQSEGVESVGSASRSNTPSAAASRKSSVDSEASRQTTAKILTLNGASATTSFSGVEPVTNTANDVGKSIEDEDDDSNRIIADTPL